MYSSRVAHKAGVGILCLLLSLRAESSEPVEITVPPVRVWCATGSPDPSTDEAEIQAESFHAAQMAKLQAEARRLKVMTIGFPFVRDDLPLKVVAVPKPPDVGDQSVPLTTIELSICSVVPAGAPAPEAPITEDTLPSWDGLAMACDGPPDPCMEKVEAALKLAPWNLTSEAIESAVHRSHPALSQDDSADALVASLTSSRDLLVIGDQLPGFAPDRVVVAVLLKPSGDSTKPQIDGANSK